MYTCASPHLHHHRPPQVPASPPTAPLHAACIRWCSSNACNNAGTAGERFCTTCVVLYKSLPFNAVRAVAPFTVPSFAPCGAMYLPTAPLLYHSPQVRNAPVPAVVPFRMYRSLLYHRTCTAHRSPYHRAVTTWVPLNVLPPAPRLPHLQRWCNAPRWVTACLVRSCAPA